MEFAELVARAAGVSRSTVYAYAAILRRAAGEPLPGCGRVRSRVVRLRLPVFIKEALGCEAARLGVSVSEVVRRILLDPPGAAPCPGPHDASITVKVPAWLYGILRGFASSLGVSVSEAVRMVLMAWYTSVYARARRGGCAQPACVP